MRFSIITPSFQSAKWLNLCIASVADQSVDLEHIIQDAGSTDGTADRLLSDRRVKAFIEKDNGMYDAVNRGFQKASGEIFAYLNCDEQYLPGALVEVERYFEDHPSIEVAFGDVIVVNPLGEFLSHRKSLIPLKPHSMVSNNLSILTCATFFRRSVFEKRKLSFNSNLRDVGDADWLLRCLQEKVPMGLLGRFTSVFTDTGENMNFKPNALREKKQFYDLAPGWAKALRQPIILHHRLRKLFSGAYRQKPFSYEIYTLADSEKRTTFDVARPSGRWNPHSPQPV